MSNKMERTQVRAELDKLKKRSGWGAAALAGLLKPKAGKGKGSDFERRICKRLSLWWSDGKRDDIFWRSHGSGGRATARGRRGQQTAGQYGDITASDPVGQALIDVFAIEVKRGYYDQTPFDTVDSYQAQRPRQTFTQFMQQATDAHRAAGSITWAVIHQRDKRMAMLYMPAWFHKYIYQHTNDRPPQPRIMFNGAEWESVYGYDLELWLDRITPKSIKLLSEIC